MPLDIDESIGMTDAQRRAFELSVEIRRNHQRADHYRTLGLTTDASPSDIKKAYKKLSLMFYPDKNKSRRFRNMADDQERL